MVDSIYGPLSAAIVHRSESDAKRILQDSPHSILERNSRGQTPLHLSCSWPNGITLLFHYGALELIDREDNKGSLPLAYSCACECSEAARLILEADSALLSLQHAESGGPLEDFDGRLPLFGDQSTDAIRSHVFTALVDRRRRLRSLAITQLCHEELEDLGVTDDRLLDEKASSVYKALERRNVVIPSALRVPFRQTTVFHDERLTQAIGESLYKCGFLDVDGIDFLGFTPLMANPVTTIKVFFQRASWLVSKGADFGRKPGRSESMPSTRGITAAHKLCLFVGRAVGSDIVFGQPVQPSEIVRTRFPEFFETLEGDCQALIGDLVSSNFYDRCLCACSSQGCTPATMLLKGCQRGVSMLGLEPISSTHLRIFEWMNGLMGHRHGVWQRFSQELIRYETFEMLELTHTCCTFNGRGDDVNDSTELKEIRDEERFLISKLETLVAEFTEKYNELGVSLPEFLKGYWKTRMEEIESEEEALDEEEIAKIEAFGVVIRS